MINVLQYGAILYLFVQIFIILFYFFRFSIRSIKYNFVARNMLMGILPYNVLCVFINILTKMHNYNFEIFFITSISGMIISNSIVVFAVLLYLYLEKKFSNGYTLNACDKKKQFKILKNNYKEIDGKRVYRIRAKKSFYCNGKKIRRGECGGYISSCSNLLSDNSWISSNCVVMNDARIYDNCLIENGAIIKDFSEISGDCGPVIIRGNVIIGGKSNIINKREETLVIDNSLPENKSCPLKLINIKTKGQGFTSIPISVPSYKQIFGYIYGEADQEIYVPAISSQIFKSKNNLIKYLISEIDTKFLSKERLVLLRSIKTIDFKNENFNSEILKSSCALKKDIIQSELNNYVFFQLVGILMYFAELCKSDSAYDCFLDNIIDTIPISIKEGIFLISQVTFYSEKLFSFLRDNYGMTNTQDTHKEIAIEFPAMC